MTISATSPSFHKPCDESVMQVIKSLENENDKGSKSTKVRIGAKNEKECRKLIDQFNLLRVNRFQALKEASVQNAE